MPAILDFLIGTHTYIKQIHRRNARLVICRFKILFVSQLMQMIYFFYQRKKRMARGQKEKAKRKKKKDSKKRKKKKRELFLRNVGQVIG